MKKLQITVAWLKGDCQIKCWVWALFCAVILLYPMNGWADDTRMFELEEMVGISEEIVIGHVSHSESEWDGRLIYTTTTINVDEAIKGTPGEQVDVVQLGGTAVHPKLGAPVKMSVSDMVGFSIDEEVLLFLEKRPTGERDLVGGAQGKYEIREDSETKEKKLPIGPKNIKGRKDNGSLSIENDEMTLDSMRERIQSYMGKNKKIE